MTNAIDFRAPASVTGAGKAAANGGEKAQLPKSEIWLNPVIEIETVNEQGETVTEYVPLPYGLPIDTMNRIEKNTEFARKSNAFLEKVQRDFSALEPGQSAIIRSGILLQVRRVDTSRGRVTQSEQEAVDNVKIQFG